MYADWKPHSIFVIFCYKHQLEFGEQQESRNTLTYTNYSESDSDIGLYARYAPSQKIPAHISSQDRVIGSDLVKPSASVRDLGIY